MLAVLQWGCAELSHPSIASLTCYNTGSPKTPLPHTRNMCPSPAPVTVPPPLPPSNSSAESLDRLYPTVGSTKPPRKRTTSQCKSEPPLLRTSKRTIYTAGRPPWYNEHGTQSKEAFVIGRSPLHYPGSTGALWLSRRPWCESCPTVPLEI